MRTRPQVFKDEFLSKNMVPQFVVAFDFESDGFYFGWRYWQSIVFYLTNV